MYGVIERDGVVIDLDARTVGGAPARGFDLAMIDGQRRQMDAEAVSRTAVGVADTARQALTDVLALAALYPFGTVEEIAIVDTQAAAALAAYRALDDPPADVTSLAAAVVAWRVAL